MKFTVTFKDPDTLDDSCLAAAHDSLIPITALDAEVRDQVTETRRKQFRDFVRPWVRHGEYITIEFDTDAGTATVVKEKL